MYQTYKTYQNYGLSCEMCVEESPKKAIQLMRCRDPTFPSVTMGYSSKLPGSRLNTICAMHPINMGPIVGSSSSLEATNMGPQIRVNVPIPRSLAQNEDLPTWILKNDPWVPSQMFPSKFLLYHCGATSENTPKTQNNNLETTVSVQGHVHPACHHLGIWVEFA